MYPKSTVNIVTPAPSFSSTLAIFYTRSPESPFLPILPGKQCTQFNRFPDCLLPEHPVDPRGGGARVCLDQRGPISGRNTAFNRGHVSYSNSESNRFIFESRRACSIPFPSRSNPPPAPPCSPRSAVSRALRQRPFVQRFSFPVCLAFSGAPGFLVRVHPAFTPCSPRVFKTGPPV